VRKKCGFGQAGLLGNLSAFRPLYIFHFSGVSIVGRLVTRWPAAPIIERLCGIIFSFVIGGLAAVLFSDPYPAFGQAFISGLKLWRGGQDGENRPPFPLVLTARVTLAFIGSLMVVTVASPFETPYPTLDHRGSAPGVRGWNTRFAFVSLDRQF